jgi:hypothetical protein
MAEPLTIAVVAVAAAITPFNNGPFPGSPLGGGSARIEQLYKENNRIIGKAILDPDAADAACPAGYETRRQLTREDGAKVYLVWDLHCRRETR